MNPSPAAIGCTSIEVIGTPRASDSHTEVTSSNVTGVEVIGRTYAAAQVRHAPDGTNRNAGGW